MAKQWIQKATSKNKGALREKLGAKPGKDIPEKKLQKAAKSKDPKLAKEARLAETLRKLRKK
jgi:hypothetical protein